MGNPGFRNFDITKGVLYITTDCLVLFIRITKILIKIYQKLVKILKRFFVIIVYSKSFLLQTDRAITVILSRMYFIYQGVLEKVCVTGALVVLFARCRTLRSCDKKLSQIRCQTSVLECFPGMNFIPSEAIFLLL